MGKMQKRIKNKFKYKDKVMQHKKILTKVKRVIKEIYILKEREYSIRKFVALFKVNKRTIERDLKDIKSLGFNIEFCKQGTYRIFKEIDEVAKNDEIMKFNEKKYREKQIVRVRQKEDTYFNAITKDTAMLKQDGGGNFFYFIKDSLNQIKYMSDKFATRSQAIKDLKLAL